MLIFSVVFLVRFSVALRQPNLPLTVARWYLPLTGIIWGFSCLALSFGLFLGRGWAFKMTSWLSFVFALWYWVDRLTLVQTDQERISRPASAILTVVVLGLLQLILRRPSVKAYFGENA